MPGRIARPLSLIAVSLTLILAFDATTGKKLLVSFAGAEVGAPVVVNGMVYFETALDGKIVALHLPGKTL